MKTPAILLFFSVFSISVNAQSIKGRIIDEQGLPIPDASITIKGSFLGTIADREGTFKIPLKQPGTYTIVANSVGYEPHEQEVEVLNSEAIASFTLARAAGSLKEVT